MLQNAHLLAKIGADTAENERNFAENLPKIGNYPTGPLPVGYKQVAQRAELADAVSRFNTTVLDLDRDMSASIGQ